MDCLKIDDKTFPIEYRTSLKTRRMGLRVCHKSSVIKISLHPSASQREGYQFALKHQDWIKRQFQEVEQLEEQTQITIVGRVYQIRYIPCIRDAIEIEEEEIKLFHTGQTYLKDMIKGAAKELLKDYLEKVVPEYAERIGETYNRIVVKDITTRWGSCSSLKNLNFSVRLAFAPLNCINYVIAHEVAHLRHLNHSKDFWDLVEILHPNYKRDIKALKSLKLV